MARQNFVTGVSVNAGNKEIKLYAKYIDIKVSSMNLTNRLLNLLRTLIPTIIGTPISKLHFI